MGGCVPSKLARKELKKKRLEKRSRKISVPNHRVALTSSTYGLLKLDSSPKSEGKCEGNHGLKSFGLSIEGGPQINLDASKWLEEKQSTAEVMEEDEPEPETINAWELMDGLDDDISAEDSPPKKIVEKMRKTTFFHTVEEVDGRAVKVSGSTPLSEKKVSGKENVKPVCVCNLGSGKKSVLRPSKMKSAVGVNDENSPLSELKRNNSPAKGGNVHVTPDSVVLPKVGRDNNNGGSVPPKQAPRILSLGALTDLRVASSRLNSRFHSYVDLIKEPNSPLFDPDLLASFEKALENLSEENWNSIRRAERDRESPLLRLKTKDPLENFEEKCPPGGENAVVLYTTTLRGIRKTFEDCNKVRSVLESCGVCISERDVSMHLSFRNELVDLMGKLVTVPRLFVKGRYIGGVDEVLRIHEQGRLSELLEGLPTDMAGKICDGCGGVRFVPCLECSGSRKLVDEDNKVIRCPECNENGLIQCPICC
eukprot:Gb_37928 [translate_table: standard]